MYVYLELLWNSGERGYKESAEDDAGFRPIIKNIAIERTEGIGSGLRTIEAAFLLIAFHYFKIYFIAVFIFLDYYWYLLKE